MNTVGKAVAVLLAAGTLCWAARCTTVAPPGVLREYDTYVAAAEQAMDRRFDSGELAWVPAQEAKQAAVKLASGLLVRWNVSDAALNERLAGQNGTVIHWIGAVRIPGATLADVRSVLEDFDGYARIYHPMVFQCQAVRNMDVPHTAYDLTLGLQSEFKVAALFPQHYAFRAKARIDLTSGGGSSFGMHLTASEIRESDSGVPGRADFLEPYHDHGIMWGLNAYWRARQQGPNVYLEFESITLARSVREFVCKIGFVPIPKSIVVSAMDSLPADCVNVILEGTRAECARRAPRTMTSQ
jgi:hypothetical protein